MMPDAVPGADLIGQRVGHLRVVRRLGEGGWGAVYEAVDETLNRRVALKAIHPDRLDGQARARLRREARILSRLEDPNICRIYGYESAGAGGAGDFLVLELVEGRTLRDALRDEPGRLTRRLRLRIAEQLAGVLVRTHAEGIVHRDLKPSNVMLTPADEVKVLDFGIASAPTASAALGGGDAATAHAAEADKPVTLFETHRGRVLGTAHYMSPEQARGERITPASDMYSLGLLLQEQFTGHLPHPPGLTLAELLARAMAGESEPAVGLPADLTRLITRLKSPVPVDRPTAADARRVLRRIIDTPRRRLRVAAVAVALLLVAGGLLAHNFRLRRERNAAVAARQQADRARVESEKARLEAVEARAEAQQVVDFLVGMFSVADPGESRGRTITADELVRRGAENIERELENQPLVRARLMATIGTVYRELGLYDDAERFVRQALEQRRAAAAEPREVASSLRGLGILHSIRARYDEAEAALREALAIEEQALGKDHVQVAATLTSLGEVLRHRGDGAAADLAFRRAIAIQERHPEANRDLAKSLNNLAGVLWRAQRIVEAEPLMQRVLAIEESELGADHPRLARTLNNLGLLTLEQGRHGEAETVFRRALAIKERALGAEHPELASTVFNLGDSRWRQGDLDGAVALFERALVLDEKGGGPDHPNVAFTLTGLAGAYRDLERWSDAEAAYRRALAIFDRTIPGHPARRDVVEGWDELRRRRAARAE